MNIKCKKRKKEEITINIYIDGANLDKGIKIWDGIWTTKDFIVIIRRRKYDNIEKTPGRDKTLIGFFS